MPIMDAQASNKQHPVPQNIDDVEFKIIGELTMRQFIYLMIFFGIAYGCFVLITNIFKWPLVLFFVGTGVLAAFGNFEGRGVDVWIVNFYKAIYKPNQRIWKKAPTVPNVFLYQDLDVLKRELITLAPTSSRRKLEEYLHQQDSNVEEDSLDLPIRDYIKKVQDAFEYEVTAQTKVVLDTPVVTTPIPPQTLVQKPDTNKDTKDTSDKNDKKGSNQQAQEPQTPAPTPPPQPKKPKLPELKLPERDTGVSAMPLEPITPDRHSGRRFTSLLPSAGEIVLPIRGERIIKTSEETNIEKEIAEKTAQLKQLLEQVKSDKKYSNTLQNASQDQRKQVQKSVIEGMQPRSGQKPNETRINKEATEMLEHVGEEKQKVTQQIEKLKTEMTQKQDPVEKTKMQQQIQQLEQEKQKAMQDYNTLLKTVKELQDKLEKKQSELPKVIVQKVFDQEGANQSQQAQGNNNSGSSPTFAKMQPMTNNPNIITGVVKNSDGEALSGVVVIIKSMTGEPARALKTNTLGQFSISTPLANGSYMIEVDKFKKTGFNFDIINVEVKGEVIPPIELVGKI